MRPKRPRVVIKAESSDEDCCDYDYDEKENVMPQQPRQQIGKEPTKPAVSIKIEEEEDIIQLSHYWPHGSGVVYSPNEKKPPEDTSLLHLYSIDASVDDCLCDICPSGLNEMLPCFMYQHETAHKLAALEDHPKELREFQAKFDAKTSHKINVSVVLRTSGCSEQWSCFKHYSVSRSRLIKAFRFENTISFYLKVDAASILEIPKSIKHHELYSHLLERYQNGGMGGSEPVRNGLSDTFDFPEAEIPAGFKVNLRDYQKRSISWMKSIEAIEPNESNTIIHDLLLDDKDPPIKFKLGDSPYYLTHSSLETANGNMATTTKTEKREPLRFYGGILADDTGSGKTITTLGLIHAAPFTQEHQKHRASRFKKQFILRFNPEPAALCVPQTFTNNGCRKPKSVSWKDVVEADLVIVSYQFLANSNYSEIGRGYTSAVSEWADFSETKGRVILQELHFHRIIFDEFHELSAAKKSILATVEHLKGDYFWGLTGTPKSNDPLGEMEYLKPSQRLHDVCSKNTMACREITRKHVKRNLPDLELPGVQNETAWIDLSAHELNLLRWKSQQSSTSIKEQIMMCSHYQLSEKESVHVEEFVPVAVAQKRMSKGKEAEIDSLKRRLIQQRASIQAVLEKDPQISVAHLKSGLKATESQLQSAESSFNYFQSVFKVIGEPDKNECRICFGHIDESSLAILPCSHLFCYSCITPFVEKSKACPLCRHAVPKVSDIFRIRIHKPEQLLAANGHLETLDTSKYSSKLIGLYRYITDLIESDRSARIILFLQYRDLADFIAKSFKELNVECVRVVGTVFQRQNAIAKFRDSPDIRLIMMSSEDSVSGINLTQATHVILLHPFYTGQGESVDLAYEKQGISRAYRFGLDHALKIVRFAARGTIEEEITLRRQ